MNIFTTFSFIAGVIMLIVHFIQDMDHTGFHSDLGVSATGLLVATGVAHMLWGKK